MIVNKIRISIKRNYKKETSFGAEKCNNLNEKYYWIVSTTNLSS